MRYLTSALISEGPTDDRFMPRLLTRMLTDTCVSEFDDPVEVADVSIVRKKNSPSSVAEIVSLVNENSGAFSIVFVHRDQGARDSRRVEQEWLEPLREQWGNRDELLVTVVPIRETEAWMLADGDALRKALGVRWSDREMGVPTRRAQVEGIADPKRRLEVLGERLGRPIVNYFDRLGEFVSLGTLMEVPAYYALRQRVVSELHEMGFR